MMTTTDLSFPNLPSSTVLPAAETEIATPAAATVRLSATQAVEIQLPQNVPLVTGAEIAVLVEEAEKEIEIFYLY